MKLFADFPTDIESIHARIKGINPDQYARSRNFKDGAVSRLSPYISRGIISTKKVYQHILDLDLPFSKTEKFIQELAWRDYWQQIWITKGDDIDKDLKHQQTPINNHQIPKAIADGNTGIEAIDQAITELKTTGYMHNHMRMYVAAVACNVAQSHWLLPAQWMYSLLYDGDWASNALSWQWVAGANANKKYYANQENINRYFYSNQRNTFLDIPYESFNDMPIPKQLEETIEPTYDLELPKVEALHVDTQLPSLIYNYYNLDPAWKKGENCNRILLLEPSFFKRYPIQQKVLDFFLSLTENIPNLQIFVGEFQALKSELATKEIYFKEHPSNRHYQGTEVARDWMFDVEGYYPSFFTYWKRCKKQIKQ